MGYESLLQYIKWKELVGQEQAIAKLKEYDFYISAEEQIRREGELAICLVDILKSNIVVRLTIRENIKLQSLMVIIILYLNPQIKA